MNDGHALLAASRERPGDDTPHLVYADWADDTGMPHAAAHIRNVIAQARKPRSTTSGRQRPMTGSYTFKTSTGDDLGPNGYGVALYQHPNGTSTVQVLHAAPYPDKGWTHEHYWDDIIPHTEAAERVRNLVAEGHHPVDLYARHAAEGLT